MHISNDRYFEDRQRHDLALRMIRHEARTCTIRSCTGLSDDRIRRLYQTYASHAPDVPIRRHRGKSPRQIAFFTRNTQVQFESSILAGLFAAFGLLDSSQEAKAISLMAGRLFCDAYETHLQLLESSTLSFEHAWFLLHLLRRNMGVGTSRCRHCDGQFLHDRSTVVRRACPACTLKGSQVRMERLRSRVRKRSQKPRPALISEIRAPQTAEVTVRLPA